MIPRPNRKFKSAAGNGYIKVLHEGTWQNVVLDRQANEDWDKIEGIEIGAVDYANSMLPDDEQGKPTGPGFTRLEIVDYVTYSRKDMVDEMLVRREERAKRLLKEIKIDSVAKAEELA